MARKLTQETFEPHVGSEFTATDEKKKRHRLKLIKVVEGRADPRLEQFSLIFHGAKKRVLPQRIYPFEHGKIGKFKMFIVPIGRDENEERTLYQAAFSRIRANLAPGS